MTNFITAVRKHLNEKGVSEIALREKYEDLQRIWKQKQKLLQEMQQAQQQAAEAAAGPYLQQIQDLDQNYATIISLIADV